MRPRLSAFVALLVAAAAVSPATSQTKINKPLSAEEQKTHFTVPKGFEVELIAAEPLVINPITMTTDEKGRIYVSESHTYRYGPKGSPVKPFTNPIIRLDPLPDGKGYKRTVVAEEFEEPVMGLAIRNGKLWVTADNFLYLYDLAEDGKATNKRTLLTDKNKAWNPFGMFVIEWGPDGLLYMSVGNHNIDIGGPNGRIGGRGSSGIVMRMKPDGSDMERLVHGLRVPYSFEYDPFGQLWVLSNGEGNPDRFVRVLDGVDYHCYSRGSVDNNWLAGRHPLAPPCFELGRGAHTQLIRYYGAAFPTAYQGSLLLDNWGAHGFNGANRAIFRFVPDDHGTIVKQEMFVSCADPHFRPSHIILDPDGNLIICDWYGRDDESDLTGRIWRVKYTGTDKPTVTHKLDAPEWKDDAYAVSALASPHHLIREKATNELISRGNRVVGKLAEYAATAKEPLGAANALWVLVRIATPESQTAITSGAKHPDWHVRRLSVNILRRYKLADADRVAKQLGTDADPAVRVEAALANSTPDQIRTALLAALEHGAAKDDHLRYEAAWHLAKHADSNTFIRLLSSPDENVRLAGMIAIDVACFEGFASKPLALAVLGKELADPERKQGFDLLLMLARLDGDASTVAALHKLLARNDIPAATTAQTLLVLRGKGATQGQTAAAGKRFLEAVESGAIKLTSSGEQVVLLELLETEGPTPFALKQIGSYLSGAPQVRTAAHNLARRFGPKASPLAESLWPRALNAKGGLEDRVDLLGTIARIEAAPNKAGWEKLLVDSNAVVRAETVRWWRGFKGNGELTELLVRHAPDLIKEDATVKDDLSAVLRHLDVPPAVLAKLALPEPPSDKDELGRQVLADIAKLPTNERQQKVFLGRQVFERTGCTKCHTTVNENTLLAPSLKGIATAQKADYLVESVLYPSKVIKTGYETEQILTKNGKTLTGLVREEGQVLRVLTADNETRISKQDVEERVVLKVSLMPEGQEKLLSRQEFADLIAYLLSLK